VIGVVDRSLRCSSSLSLPAIFGFEAVPTPALDIGIEPTVNGSSELPAAERATVVVVYPDEFQSSFSRGGEMTLFLEGVKRDTKVLFYFISSVSLLLAHMFKLRISLLSHL
jgi:hypothetical protein